MPGCPEEFSRASMSGKCQETLNLLLMMLYLVFCRYVSQRVKIKQGIQFLTISRGTVVLGCFLVDMTFTLRSKRKAFGRGTCMGSCHPKDSQRSQMKSWFISFLHKFASGWKFLIDKKHLLHKCLQSIKQ